MIDRSITIVKNDKIQLESAMQRMTGWKATMVGSMAIAGVVAVLYSATSNNAAAQDKVAGAKPLFKFPTATFLVDTYATDFVAKDHGIFEKHWLDVTFTYPPSGATAAQLLLAGEIRGWNGPMDFAILSAAKGADLKMAGMPFPATTDYIVISSKGTWPARNAPYEEKIKALKGKVIGVSPTVPSSQVARMRNGCAEPSVPNGARPLPGRLYST